MVNFGPAESVPVQFGPRPVRTQPQRDSQTDDAANVYTNWSHHCHHAQPYRPGPADGITPRRNGNMDQPGSLAIEFAIESQLIRDHSPDVPFRPALFGFPAEFALRLES